MNLSLCVCTFLLNYAGVSYDLFLSLLYTQQYKYVPFTFSNTFLSDLKLQQFKKAEDQAKVLYLILNAKACPGTELLNLLNSSGNQKAAGIFEEKKISTGERDQWPRLQKMITDNIDRMSSHTMHLGLVLCFASGIGLISGRDREIIVSFSLQKGYHNIFSSLYLINFALV